jgi:hypothetical protein
VQMRIHRAVLAMLAVVLGLAFFAYVVGDALYSDMRVRDAVFTVSGVLSREYGPRSIMPTQSEVDAVVRRLHDASVSPVWFTEDGRPVDAWGTPFRAVPHGADGVSCESAGPDRVFGTSDDIRP